MLYFLGKYILLGPFIWLIFRPIVYGRNNLKFNGGAIIISNHWSLPDPVVLASICPRWIHFMAKKELFSSKFSDFVFRKLLLTFPVDRKKPDMASIKHAMQLLKENKVFGIFPEGTRSVTGNMDRFEKGAAFLALRTGTPVIPIYSDPRAPRKCRIRIIVGEAIDPKEAVKGTDGKPLEVLTEVFEHRMRTLKRTLEDMA